MDIDMSLNGKRPLLLLSGWSSLNQHTWIKVQQTIAKCYLLFFFFFLDKALLRHSHTQSFLLKVFGYFLPTGLVLLSNCNRPLMTLKIFTICFFTKFFANPWSNTCLLLSCDSTLRRILLVVSLILCTCSITSIFVNFFY